MALAPVVRGPFRDIYLFLLAETICPCPIGPSGKHMCCPVKDRMVPSAVMDVVEVR
jgi:hypothetical protein